MNEVKVMKVRTSRFDKNPEAEIEVVLKTDYDKLSNQRDSMIIIQALNETVEKQKKEIAVLEAKLKKCMEQRNSLRNEISRHHGLNQADTMYAVKVLDDKLAAITADSIKGE